MSIERACACGHLFRLEKASPGTVCVCPKCGAVTRFDDSPPRDSASQPSAGKPLKPLWSVMGGSAPATAPSPTEPARPKGLWNVMGTTPTTKPAADVITSESRSKFVADAASVRQQISTMDHADAGNVGHDVANAELLSKIELPALESVLPVSTPRTLHTGRSKQAVWSLSLGAASLLLSFLSLMPAFWSKFPAMLVGFAAMLLGFLAAHEIRQSRGRQTGSSLAAAGILCGVLGMFLGPLVFAPLVKARQKESHRKAAVLQVDRRDT